MYEYPGSQIFGGIIRPQRVEEVRVLGSRLPERLQAVAGPVDDHAVQAVGGYAGPLGIPLNEHDVLFLIYEVPGNLETHNTGPHDDYFHGATKGSGVVVGCQTQIRAGAPLTESSCSLATVVGGHRRTGEEAGLVQDGSR